MARQRLVGQRDSRWQRFPQHFSRIGIALGIILALSGGLVVHAMLPLLYAGPQADGTGITTNGWMLTPAGRQIPLGDRPYGMALSPDGRTLLVSNDGQSTQSLMVIDRQSGKVVQTIAYNRPEALFIGLAFSPDGTIAYASAGGNNKIRVYAVAGQHLTEQASIPLAGTPFPAGLTLSADGKTLYAANNLGDSLTVLDLTTRQATLVPVGHNPFTVALARDGAVAYVSNWGDQTVSVIDTAARMVRQTITVGTHPSALALNPTRDELYVANTDSDTVTVVATTTNTVARTIDLAPYPHAQVGSSPNALAVAPGGETLYVANAGNNDVAVIRLAGAPAEDREDQGIAAQDRIVGLVPTAWYPTTLAITPDGTQLAVGNAKGLGAGPNLQGPTPYTASAPDQYVGSMIRGTLSIIDVPTREQLAHYTRQVVQNNGFDERDKVRTAGVPDERVIPRRPGDPSPIKHVIYVVKENRTYDQVLGSLGQGNGDPSLTLFGDDSAPNQRALARHFVTLDNFYANAEVSADGWNWSTAATANTYVQKTWPANYSGRHRGYDFEGGNLSTAPGADPTNSYIWDRLSRAGVTYRNYGFWASGTIPAVVAPTAPVLAAHTDTAYPGFNLQIPDQVRMDEWLKEFRQYEADGNLPTVEFVRLPNDHTAGTRPGAPTPKAMVADNDLALGRLVEAVSTSPFWSETAIFVVEDDAQNGPDHVDAHRTVAQVISPYTQTGKVDASFYSTVAMLRTMELIVGLPPLTQFDASATPMLNAFTARPNLASYTAIVPAQTRNETNTASAPLATESLALDLSAEDRADEQILNQAIWQSVRGVNSIMPLQPPSAGSHPADEPDDEK